MKETYTIGELVKELNINKETIRYYEKLGLLREPTKMQNGYRIYTNEDIETFKFIRIVKSHGFTLHEISTLIHDDILCGDLKSIHDLVKDKLNEIDKKIQELSETKLLLEKVSATLLKGNIICDHIENF